jgi:hypothetical protein
MNLLANPLADAQKVWNNVKGAKEPRGGSKAAADKENDIAVFSFITPSIIGKLNKNSMSCIILPCLALSCLVLPCLVLSCLVLSCLILPNSFSFCSPGEVQ